MKLYIGFPAYDGRLMASTFVSTMQFLMRGNSKFTSPPVFDCLFGHSHVNRARNLLVKRFLDTDCTHLLFVDSDISFVPDRVTMLLGRDLPVVGGIYAKKEIGPAQWVVDAIRDGDVPDETGLLEVKCAGTGFLLIKREVFEQMLAGNIERQKANATMITRLRDFLPPAAGEDIDYIAKLCDQDALSYEDDSGKLGTCWNFFHSGVWGNRWLSEDWWFSSVWRSMGGKIYADMRCQLAHVGHADYPIRSEPMTLARAVEKLRAKQKDIFFVQIGANDGVTDDPVRPFVERYKLSGILVEPHPTAFAELVKNYEGYNVECINAAIAHGRADAILHTFKNAEGKASQLTSFDGDAVKNNTLGFAGEVETIQVKAVSLSEIMESAVTVDLLQIDTEGFDYEILKMLPSCKTKLPSIIHFEHAFLRKPDLDECYQMLAKWGYNIETIGIDTLAWKDL